MGVYEDGTFNGAGTKTYLDTAISQANTYSNVEAVVVGNECLPGDPIGNPVTVAQMIADLQYVKAGITNKNIKVTTCLTYSSGASVTTDYRWRPIATSLWPIFIPFMGVLASATIRPSKI